MRQQISLSLWRNSQDAGLVGEEEGSRMEKSSAQKKAALQERAETLSKFPEAVLGGLMDEGGSEQVPSPLILSLNTQQEAKAKEFLLNSVF